MGFLTTTEQGLLGDGTPYTYTTTYTYYPNGKLQSIDGPRTDVSDSTTYTYDSTTGYLTSMTQPIIGATTYSNFDALGNPQTVTDPNNNVTSYTYNNLKQLTRTTFPDAAHEDYTLKLVLDSGLAAEIRRRFGARGIEPEHVAALICGRPPPGADPFRSGGRDLLPILRQVVSGELDADRMDYLQRDSFFTGVNYGKFDSDWIIQNLTAVEREGRVHLALQRRAVFAFEDFLLSRYHMFLSVYFHYTSVGYEMLLQRYCQTSGGEYTLPADPDEFLAHDDVALLSALRASSNPWAKRIVRRQGYRMLAENEPGMEEKRARLAEAGIDAFTTISRGVLSHYGKETTLWVKSPRGEAPIAESTPLYERYAEAATLARLYVEPERYEEARRLLGA